MKPTLSITEKEFTIIPSATSRGEQMTRDSVIRLAWMFTSYHKDWSELGGLISQRNIGCNVSYVNALFTTAPYLYQYYELSQRHFDLLDCAATNIERLYNEKIRELISNPGAATETRVQLASCLEKITLIFQTAADKTEDKDRAFVYGFNAKRCLEKVNMYLGVKSQESYIATMQRLYSKYSGEPLVGHFLQLRSQDYQAKLEEEMLSSAPRSTSSSFSSHGSSIPSSPRLFAPSPPPVAADEQQSLLTHRSTTKDPFALDN